MILEAYGEIKLDRENNKLRFKKGSKKFFKDNKISGQLLRKDELIRGEDRR